jgi:hypothetical protein
MKKSRRTWNTISTRIKGKWPECMGKCLDNPTCERCLEEEESATHILCDCEAIAYLRFRHLGQFFVEPNNYYNASINKVLHFFRSAGLIKC